MADHQNHRLKIQIFSLLTFSYFLSNILGDDGIKSSSSVMKNYTLVGRNGEIIDCVDIYKQPAFSNPLLKNHVIQKRPTSSPDTSSHPRLQNEKELLDKIRKNYRACPEGTIPILRTKLFKDRKTAPIFSNTTNPNYINLAPNLPRQEYAVVQAIDSMYYGASASLNNWNPATFDGEFSSAQIWVHAGNQQDLNSVEAGWQVKAPQTQARFFIYWTRDNYKETGCYNHECPGFVQTNKNFPIGSLLVPSAYSGRQTTLPVTIFKDMKSGNWWVKLLFGELGYWPAEILTSLNGGAGVITWGGEVLNKRTNGRHTSTQMGNGHFPEEGFSKAAVISDLKYISDSGMAIDADKLTPVIVSNPSCYDLHIGDNKTLGVNFFYGGPGFSDDCK